MLYLLNRYPCRSETFIQQEVRLLLETDVSLRFAALCRGDGALLQPHPPLHYFDDDGTAAAADSSMTRRSYTEPAALARTLSRWKHGRMLTELCTLLRQERHVHAQFADVAALLGKTAAHRTKGTYSVSVHARDVFCCKYGLRYLLGDARFVVVCNTAARDRVLAECPGLAARLHLIEHGLLLSEWPLTSRGSRGPRLNLLFAGRLVPKKGLAHLLRALAECHDVPWRLTVAGDGPEGGRLRALSDSLGLAAVAWAGWLSPPELRAAMQQSDCLLVPSEVAGDDDRDGIPNVVVEAMASGLPVLGSDAGGLGSVLNETTGWTYSAGDTAGLTAALAAMAAAPVARAERSRAARAMVERRFDACRLINQQIQLFKEVSKHGGQ